MDVFPQSTCRTLSSDFGPKFAIKKQSTVRGNYLFAHGRPPLAYCVARPARPTRPRAALRPAPPHHTLRRVTFNRGVCFHIYSKLRAASPRAASRLARQSLLLRGLPRERQKTDRQTYTRTETRGQAAYFTGDNMNAPSGDCPSP